MKLLILDTSQSKAVAMLHRQGSALIKKEFDAQCQQKFLIDSIDFLLKEADLSLTDLTGIAICIGPGSFTGTRIGVMTAKTLSYANHLPLIPFNSLLPYHTENTLTLLGLKNNLCFCFDGQIVKKITYQSLFEEKRPLFSLNPETLPIPAFQAIFSPKPILILAPSHEANLIY